MQAWRFLIITLAALGLSVVVGAQTYAPTVHQVGAPTAGQVAVFDRSGWVKAGSPLAIAQGGTGAATALAAFDALKQSASTTYAGVSEFATTAEIRANTSGLTLSTDQTWAAADYATLTDAATIAVDMSAGYNFTVTLTDNRTLGNPTNTKNGQTGLINVSQDATGSRTLAYSSNWKFAGGVVPILTTGTASARDLLFYQVISSTVIYATLVKDVK